MDVVPTAKPRLLFTKYISYAVAAVGKKYNESQVTPPSVVLTQAPPPPTAMPVFVSKNHASYKTSGVPVPSRPLASFTTNQLVPPLVVFINVPPKPTAYQRFASHILTHRRVLPCGVWCSHSQGEL